MLTRLAVQCINIGPVSPQLATPCARPGAVHCCTNSHRPSATVPVFCITTGISAALVQSFLISRVFRLTKRYWVAAILLVGTTVSLAGAIWSGVATAENTLYADRGADDAGVSMWLISSAATDVGIAAALLVFLLRARSEAVKFEGSQLRGPLNRMIKLTIETGGLTTAWALVALIVYLHDNTSNEAVAMGYCLGRLYALTMLYSLNQRGREERVSRNTTKNCQCSSSSVNPGLAQNLRVMGLTTSAVGGVSVHTTSQTQVERSEHELSHLHSRGRVGMGRAIDLTDDETEEEKEVGEAMRIRDHHDIV